VFEPGHGAKSNLFCYDNFFDEFQLKDFHNKISLIGSVAWLETLKLFIPDLINRIAIIEKKPECTGVKICHNILFSSNLFSFTAFTTYLEAFKTAAYTTTAETYYPEFYIAAGLMQLQSKASIINREHTNSTLK